MMRQNRNAPSYGGFGRIWLKPKRPPRRWNGAPATDAVTMTPTTISVTSGTRLRCPVTARCDQSTPVARGPRLPPRLFVRPVVDRVDGHFRADVVAVLVGILRPRLRVDE